MKESPPLRKKKPTTKDKKNKPTLNSKENSKWKCPYHTAISKGLTYRRNKNKVRFLICYCQGSYDFQK